MASRRLTNWNRDCIVTKAIADHFDVLAETIQSEVNTVVATLVERLAKPEELALARQLPREWLSLDSSITVNLGGWSVSLQVKGYNFLLPRFLNRGRTPVLTLNDPLCVLAREIVTRRDKIGEDRKTARTKLTALLQGCRTVAHLKQVWPEGEKYYAGLDTAVEPSRLPVATAQEVNTLLGLPKESVQ